MNIIATIPETFADGPGIRYSIYSAGCTHNCPGCHNPKSHDFDQGTPIEDAWPTIYKQIASNPMLTGITISGGDPMQSPDGLYYLLKSLKANFPEKDIWVYTGYQIEEIMSTPKKILLKYIDVLVDGKYDYTKRDLSEFKGSTNQRIIEKPYYFTI